MIAVRSSSFIAGTFIVILTWGLLACGGPWRDGYFKKGVSRLTQDEVAEKMGPPHTTKTPALGGDTVWTYRVPLSERELNPMDFSAITGAANEAAAMMGKGGPEGPKPTLYCYRYILTFDEQKVLKQWKREECVPGTRDLLTADH